jgi:hypothetical protein
MTSRYGTRHSLGTRAALEVAALRRAEASRFIVKVQRPLASSERDPPALVYDETQSLLLFAPLTGIVAELLEGEPFKVYAYAQLEADGRTLRLLERAPAQDW